MVSLTQPQHKKSHEDQTPSSEQAAIKISSSSATLKNALDRWQIQLNASLELRDVLNCFFNGVNKIVRCAGLTYSHRAKGIALELGGKKIHCAQYALKARGYSLGDIVFTRARPFSDEQLQQLEESLALLFYPLRNALLYKEALDNSLRDALTGLANRAAFELSIKRELGMAKRHNLPLSMIIIDIDHFKGVNDTYGHHAGDCLLTHVGKVLKNILRETDQVFRFGGEEFVILLANANLAAGNKVAQRARKAIAKSHIHVGKHLIGVTVSMGVSTFCAEDDRNTLFKRADEALYCAKNTGRNRVNTEWDLHHNPDSAR
ncbi:GGDEF domain-containing protein [Marinagarivorans algicola]|uniref:GGDEF domain-containing protein n=1 Tax=Marinagarivorans algicola TaxID=1513270 RepID=UPI0006B4BB81|nr:GGDEF domain-containing protein [Marinagarivorans algicola]